ncbi:MAG: tyrosine-type recombinase/integrase [Candidatus Nanopelagicales bacterium]|nr:tyrosine-type recombinase/integrase [Candidatus Nanopelagicales bacterium]
MPNPHAGETRFGPYAVRWIEERPGLRPRTVQLYEWTYRRHLAPSFEHARVQAISLAMVRTWRADLIRSGVSGSLAAKAYRLLRAILGTAVDDDLIERNPCRIRGAGVESPNERPVLTTQQVFALADLMPARLRCMVLIATFASLRYGEVAALRRRDLDFGAGTVRVSRALTEIRGQGLAFGPPKSRAGVRTVSVPNVVMSDLADHLHAYMEEDPQALVFTGPKGAPIRRGNFNSLARWKQIVRTIGAEGLHFHDLRHTGNMLAAAAGGSTRDLMARMGHSSMTAALLYQHATARADRHIADQLDSQVRAARQRADS